jgi:hypothetical protein
MKSDPFGATTEIEYAHYLCHQGLLWAVTDIGTGVLIAGPKIWSITVGANPLHMEFSVSAGATGLMELLELNSITDGTPITPINYNRIAGMSRPILSTFFKDSTAPSISATLMSKLVPTGYNVAGNRSGMLRDGAEFNLKPSTKYAIRFTTDTDTVKAGLMMACYEPIVGRM